MYCINYVGRTRLRACCRLLPSANLLRVELESLADVGSPSVSADVRRDKTCFVDYREDGYQEVRKCVSVMGGLAHALNQQQSTQMLLPERAQVPTDTIVPVLY